MPGTRRAGRNGARRRDSFADVPGFSVGHWSDPEAATGCTVILAPEAGCRAAVSVRGGAPGTRETDVLKPGNIVERIHAVLLTGGSAFGLNAAGGVMRYLEEAGRGFETRGGRVPIVLGAVLYDLSVGNGKVRPGEREGYLASAGACSHGWPEGSVGAGTGATVAKAGGIARAWKGGIASASETLHDGTVVAAIAAVNAYGDVRDPENGAIIARPRADARGRVRSALEIIRERGSRPEEVFLNTTLVVVATTASLNRDQLLRAAEMGHAGMSRAVEPSHTPADGDIVFALATGEHSEADAERDLTAIGSLGAHAVARAIARAVTSATGLAGVPGVMETVASARR